MRMTNRGFAMAFSLRLVSCVAGAMCLSGCLAQTSDLSLETAIRERLHFMFLHEDRYFSTEWQGENQREKLEPESRSGPLFGSFDNWMAVSRPLGDLSQVGVGRQKNAPAIYVLVPIGDIASSRVSEVAERLRSQGHTVSVSERIPANRMWAD